jgi:A/G-specific adenine glycosylase
MPEPPDISPTDGQWSSLRRTIIDWWREQEFDFPWRRPAQEPWKGLVTEILLQRTRASAVADVYRQFFDTYQAPSDLAAASEEDIREMIRPLGLHWRAEYLSKLGDELAERSGEVPEERADIESFPGIGQYAAGAFLTFHRHRRVPFIDANIVRLLGRFFGFDWDGETRRKRWFRDLAEAFFDHDLPPADFGYAVLDFTREVCSRSPECDTCPLSSDCQYGQNQLS